MTLNLIEIEKENIFITVRKRNKNFKPDFRFEICHFTLKISRIIYLV